MEDSFLTVADIAGMLKLNQQTVRNWIDRGVLPAIRVGPRRVRIRQSALDDFLAKGESVVAEESPSSATTANGAADRLELAAALDRAQEGLVSKDDATLAAALRELADAASRLADALST